MGIELTPAFWSGLFQIILVNIVLSGDNARPYLTDDGQRSTHCR